MGLSAETRRQRILEQLYEAGRVQVNELAQGLGVTEVTVRRDLVYLQTKLLLKKTYGGAVMMSLPEMDMSVRFRQTRRPGCCCFDTPDQRPTGCRRAARVPPQ